MCVITQSNPLLHGAYSELVTICLATFWTTNSASAGSIPGFRAVVMFEKEARLVKEQTKFCHLLLCIDSTWLSICFLNRRLVVYLLVCVSTLPDDFRSRKSIKRTIVPNNKKMQPNAWLTCQGRHCPFSFALNGSMRISQTFDRLFCLDSSERCVCVCVCVWGGGGARNTCLICSSSWLLGDLHYCLWIDFRLFNHRQKCCLEFESNLCKK